MDEKEQVKIGISESLIWEQGLRLFAMTNLSETNPFRKEIEEQSYRSLVELMRISSESTSKEDSD
ncbi:MAG: hypothetical protein KJ050_09030 [Candidatus Omnitrophica bacterium]|nr:MAG: hypothetical protein UZ16_OP3001000559 [Candidatus Hinthialibacteria bacterium OLB16]MBE7488022.1 hypothetical protein [bacterium]MBK7496357.1 hypothetical protein [Candidatus Omnitrophota bacterium]MCE7908107.1 hypothetical protein [Candidatus Omnitrophica bacterium COP1]MBV6481678.1 hypothetical protein [bacterium]